MELQKSGTEEARFIHFYVENKSRLSRHQKVQEVIDFSDKDYANWKKQQSRNYYLRDLLFNNSKGL